MSEGLVIAIASGKGGTGKTTLAVNLAHALAADGMRVQLLDCDVEEPNDHLFVHPTFSVAENVTVLKPMWQAERCTACGHCANVCKANALAVVKGQVLIFDELCNGCGACSHLCPTQALTERPVVIGSVESAPEHWPFAFAHGRLRIGEALAPAVVKATKRQRDPQAITLIDCAPGTACSVVEGVQGANAVLLVTEPTPFGLHDLELAVALTLGMGLPTAIVVNRSDGEDRLIADYAARVGLPIAGRISLRRDYAETYACGGVLVERFPELAGELRRLYRELQPAAPPAPVLESFTLAQTVPAAPAAPAPSAGVLRELCVISGKGGTGKTTITASFAHLAGRQVLADNDVDAADLHLLLAPRVQSGEDFVGGDKATINPVACLACGLCADHCHFDAIARTQGRYRIDPLSCEGCGLCVQVCPAAAIVSEPKVVGRWFVSDTDLGPLVHARLGIAEENSGKMVSRVRQEAQAIARTEGPSEILADGPPGTGCPVIASISGCDLVLMVTEPTVSGVHDLERVLLLATYFRVPAAVLINKADLDRDQAVRIAHLARKHGAHLLGEIPYDPAVINALMSGQAVVDHSDGPAAIAIRQAWQAVRAILKPEPTTSWGDAPLPTNPNKDFYMSKCIAMPIADDRVSAHFGHAEHFAFVHIDGATTTIRQAVPPAHAPGVLPKWLAEQGAQVIIAGGMGGRALALLEAAGIRCLLGVPALSIDEAIEHYRQQSLPTGEVSCSHDEGHTCQGH